MKRTTCTIIALILIASSGTLLTAKPKNHKSKRPFKTLLNNFKRWGQALNQEFQELEHEARQHVKEAHDSFKSWLNERPCVQTFKTHKALNNKQYGRLQKLLANGANVNTRDFFGQTLLHKAVAAGDTKAVEILLSHNADVNLKNHGNQTALDIALDPERHINLDVIKLLLTSDANQNQSISIHRVAQLQSNDQLPCAQLLVQYGADINATDEDGDNLLHYLAYTDFNSELVAFLFENQIDAEAKNTNGRTPLIQAVYANNTELALYLIEHDCDVEGEDNTGSTPLHYAALNNNLDVAKHLIHYRAVATHDKNGDTPLDVACSHASIEVAEFLIEMGQTSDQCSDLIMQSKLNKATEKMKSYKKQCRFMKLEDEACTMAALFLALNEDK